MADGATDERKKVIIPERALEPAVIITKHGNKERLHERDEERPMSKKDTSPPTVGGVHKSIEHAEGEDTVEHGGMTAIRIAEVHQDVAEEEPEPADLDCNGL